jgi:CheY-like chemotaxis protein
MSRERMRISNRVLIADDDPVMRCLIASVVTNEGYVPVVVSDGREAYQILRSDADFQGALLDMSMPCLNGIDLIRYMRSEKRLQRIPIMIITADQDLKLMSDSFTAGATAFLPKTFTRELLQNALRMLLRNPVGTRVAA